MAQVAVWDGNLQDTYYRRIIDNKTVRRNVTLPNWLDQATEKEHVNVSKALREAHMANLGAQKHVVGYYIE